MIQVALALAVLTPASPPPTGRIVLVGEGLSRAAVPLKALLDPRYKVFAVASNRVQGLQALRPTVVILSFGMQAGSPAIWARKKDAIVPGATRLIQAISNLPTHPKVLIWLPAPDPRQPLIGTGVLPLLRQAAREGGALVISNDPDLAVPGAGPSAAAAQTLALALGPQSHTADWVISASDSEAGEGSPQAAIDGDPDTIWHSEYSPSAVKQPHTLTIQFKHQLNAYAFTYLPRQDGGTNGIAKAFELFGTQPNGDEVIIKKGSLPGGTNRKVIRFAAPLTLTGVRFVILSEQSGGPYGSAAELGILTLP